MVKTSVLYKILVVGVIGLFFGVGIHPAFAVTPNTNDHEDECNLCAKKAGKQHLFRIKTLIDRLKKFVNILLMLSKYTPKATEKSKELSNQVSAYNKFFNKLTFEQYPIICITFLMILLSTFPILISVELLMKTFGVILFFVLLPIHLIIEGIIYFLIEILTILNCEFDPVP